MTKRRHHAAENDGHLPFLRQGHRLAAARHGVNGYQQSAQDDGEVEPPAEHGGEDDGRRVYRDAGGQAARHEKESSSEQTRLGIKPVSEIFVGGINIQPPVNRQEHGGNQDQRQRHSEIILHEIQPAFVSLAGRGNECNGAGLCGRDRNADGEPADLLVAAQIVVQVPVPARMPGAISGNGQHAADQDDEIEDVHEKLIVSASSSSTHKTKQPKTKR